MPVLTLRAIILFLSSFTVAGGVGIVAFPKLKELVWSEKPPVVQTEKQRSEQMKTEKTAGRALKTNDLSALTNELRGKRGMGPGKPSFDVARINPNGVSVFAGRAAPGAKVAILADGQVIGSVKADQNGEWLFVSNEKFTSNDPKLALSIDTKHLAAAETRVAALTPPRKAVADVLNARDETRRQMRQLEKLVDDVRKSKAAQKRGGSKTAKDNVTAARDDNRIARAPMALKGPDNAREPKSRTTRNEATSVPIPIRFHYKQATFTDQGEKAAALLLEYLKLTGLKAVALTGHADEIGSEDYNLELSRQRLETVRRYLRDGGFTGELTLKAMGESRPYDKVNRAEYSVEALHQLDRRVELRLH